MDLYNIERNQLDYVLTDVLPTELSAQFTYRYFYDFLLTKDKDLSLIANEIIMKKTHNEIVFNKEKNWVTIPLSFSIMKQMDTERTISLLQPLGAIQLYLFISAYQKEVLTLLQKNALFSIRYHTKSKDLYYKSKNKSVIKYFADIQEYSGKEIIEQTGLFFDIVPHMSLKEFTSSEEWLVLKSKYKYFIRTDYKACFDSIYTHTFNWIVGKDVNDTKDFENGSVFSAIDRVLMNINARTSNGIVVGPEFSRMVAEILLQTIDRGVFSKLLNRNIIFDVNYKVFRFVDDIFIFADSESLANEIVTFYAEESQKYLLRLNEAKQEKHRIPFVLEPWLNETNLFTNRSSELLFVSKEKRDEFTINSENTEEVERRACCIRTNSLNSNKRNIMKRFNELVCKYVDKSKTIVSYFLGMMINQVESSQKKACLFKKNVSGKHVRDFLELSLYAFSFFPNYNNAQKLLSIFSYVNDEINIMEKGEILQDLFQRYSFIFDKSNLNDIVNILLFCSQAKIEIPYQQEKRLEEQLEDKDDPILWASYLLYSQYNSRYYKEIRQRIGTKLNERIDAIVDKKKIYTYREFWWALIFNKSPHISISEQAKIDSIIPSSPANANANALPGERVGTIFVDFMKNSSKQFFEWDINQKEFLRNLTFKTRQRSIFKNYKDNLQAVNWSSIY